MDQNTFFTLLNSILTTVAIAMFYPVFKARNVDDLNEALKTRPILAKTVARNGSRSYIRTGIYFAISFVYYGVTAIGGDVEVDMNFATLSLVILFAIAFVRVWKLRKLLGAPANPVAAQ